MAELKPFRTAVVTPVRHTLFMPLLRLLCVALLIATLCSCRRTVAPQDEPRPPVEEVVLDHMPGSDAEIEGMLRSYVDKNYPDHKFITFYVLASDGAQIAGDVRMKQRYHGQQMMSDFRIGSADVEGQRLWKVVEFTEPR